MDNTKLIIYGAVAIGALYLISNSKPSRELFDRKHFQDVFDMYKTKGGCIPGPTYDRSNCYIEMTNGYYATPGGYKAYLAGADISLHYPGEGDTIPTLDLGNWDEVNERLISNKQNGKSIGSLGTNLIRVESGGGKPMTINDRDIDISKLTSPGYKLN